MALEGISGSAYREVVKPDQNIPNISLRVPSSDVAITERVNQIDSSFKQYDQSKENEQLDKAVDANLVKNAINSANNQLKFKRTKCEFTIYEDINRIAIKVIDRDTEEVIREIPPEETMELVQKLWEFAGLIVDEKR